MSRLRELLSDAPNAAPSPLPAPTTWLALCIRELLRRAPALDPAEVDDVILGCAFPEGEQGMNMARMVALSAGLPDSVPAETINRFCSSGLQSIAHGAFAIMAGQAQVVIAGGTELMSMVPMTGYKFSPMPYLAEQYPAAFTSMGLTAENVTVKYGVSRQDQDAFSLRSHQKAASAVTSGRFDPEIVPLQVAIVEPGGNGQKTVTRSFVFQRDEGPRADSSLEALAKLKPAFKEGGTVTAGNSSQMSDGAAGVVVMSRARAEALGLKPLARFIAFAVGGVPPEVMGIGPIVAIPKALKLAGLSLKEIGLVELNEAFAAQSLAVIREVGLDESQHQCQWRRHCPGAPSRLYRRQADDAAHLRDEAPGCPVRYGQHVHRRWHGRCWHLREPELNRTRI